MDQEPPRWVAPCTFEYFQLTSGINKTIRRIRHSSRLVATLPPDLQRSARESYGISLRHVFVYAACSTLLGFLVRLFVSTLYAARPCIIVHAQSLDPRTVAR